MPPQSGEPEVVDPLSSERPKITSGIFKYPALRDFGLKTPEIWLKGKKEDDGLHPYWRIHDKLYDFSDFIGTHPGGRFWLEETRGTDITESFECSHISQLPEKLLSSFYVKDITTPRNVPFTFHENGFYKTLKRKVVPILKRNGGTAPTTEMVIIQDSLLIGFLFFMYLAAAYNNFNYAIISGVILTSMMTTAHNFFHQKDNWRMYIFDLGILSSRDWRISHALSHHIYTNTIYDFEISTFEPVLQFLPLPHKSKTYKTFVGLIALLFIPISFYMEYIKNIINVIKGEYKYRIPDVLPMVELAIMAFINGSFFQSLLLWVTIHTTGNSILLFFGFIASHHHGDIFHEGDAPPEEKDWGVHQVLTTRERGEIFYKGPLLLITVTFGNHTLHHLFPTVDHSKLPLIQDGFLETCKEFGIRFEPKDLNPLEHLFGAYGRLVSTTPNPNPPRILKDMKNRN